MAAGRRSGRPLPSTVIGAAIISAALTSCVVTVGSAPRPSATAGRSLATPVRPSPSAPADAPSTAPATPATPAEDPARCTTPLSAYRIESDRTGALAAADERIVVAGLRLARRYFDVRVPECAAGDVVVRILDREHDRF